MDGLSQHSADPRAGWIGRHTQILTEPFRRNELVGGPSPTAGVNYYDTVQTESGPNCASVIASSVLPVTVLCSTSTADAILDHIMNKLSECAELVLKLEQNLKLAEHPLGLPSMFSVPTLVDN